MNRTRFNFILSLQADEDTHFKMHKLDGSSTLIKIEDLGARGSVIVLDLNGNRYRAIEKNLTFYEVPSDFGSVKGKKADIKPGCTILVYGKKESYNPKLHFWIKEKACWVNLGTNPEAYDESRGGITVTINADMMKFFKTDVKTALEAIAEKMGKKGENLFKKGELKNRKGVVATDLTEEGGLQITIDGLVVKKVVEYTLNRISDAASIISFFISSGFEKKIKEEAERLENFIDERDEFLGK
jgi:hypothetical protein